MASDESWKKLIISKSNNSWAATSNYVGMEYGNGTIEGGAIHTMMNIKEESLEDEKNLEVFKDYEEAETQQDKLPECSHGDATRRRCRDKLDVSEKRSMTDPLEVNSVKVRKKRGTSKRNESPEKRKIRLAKMSAYTAKRLATENTEARALRLARMSAHTALKLSLESVDQRRKRLAHMAAYTAKKLANETPIKRRERLDRMSIYAAKKQAEKKS